MGMLACMGAYLQTQINGESDCVAQQEESESQELAFNGHIMVLVFLTYSVSCWQNTGELLCGGLDTDVV
jgi:hypothetical protein